MGGEEKNTINWQELPPETTFTVKNPVKAERGYMVGCMIPRKKWVPKPRKKKVIPKKPKTFFQKLKIAIKDGTLGERIWKRVRVIFIDDAATKTKFGIGRKKKRRTLLQKAVSYYRDGIFYTQFLRFFWEKPSFSAMVNYWGRRFLKIKPRKIVFATFSHTYSCNPRCITEALLADGFDGELVWLVKKQLVKELQQSEIGEKVKFVRLWTWRAMYHVMTANVWIDNAQVFCFKGMPDKKPGQLYFNTWHGSLGIKRLTTAGKVVADRSARADSCTDALFTNSDFEDSIMEIFFAHTPRVRLGHARNDIFFAPDEVREATRKEILQKFNAPEDSKIILYAPTFREKYIFSSCQGIKYAVWREAFSARFGGDWIILVKLHPHDAKEMKSRGMKFPAGVYNASNAGDLTPLALAADAAISDYSSWIYDYMLSGRPGFIYAPDLEQYNTDRGFYYPLETTPFPIGRDDYEFAEEIRCFSQEKYRKNLQKFLKDKGSMDDGQACRRIVEYIRCKLEEQA